MVRQKVWNEACPDDPDMKTKVLPYRREDEGFHVCLPCLQVRLKRRLTRKDFYLSIPCNKSNKELAALLQEAK